MQLKLGRAKPRKTIVSILFLLYIALLIKVILLKYPIEMLLSKDSLPLNIRILDSNFIPMKTIFYYLSGNQSVSVARANLLGNIIAFGPLGFLLPILCSRIKRIKNIVLISGILSLTFELIQLTTTWGQFDIDDIILNVLGAIFGYIVYKAFIYLFNHSNIKDWYYFITFLFKVTT